jgi:molecular chaperone GrpE
MSMEDVKTDENPAEETADTEDAVPAEKEIESAEACGDEGAGEEVLEEETAEADSKADSGKKGFFGKKKEKKDPRDEKIEELTDRLQRSMAEFDNFRKRTEKEKSAMFEIGAKDMVERMLPVVDNFERGLAAIPEEERNSPFADGMEMIYKQLMKTLEEAGVKPIEAVGMPFDPNFHNAVMHIEDESLGENVISQELQKGYTYRDTVVRHSMVQVAN